MNKKITAYVVCVARSKFKKLFKILLCSYLFIVLAIRFLSIPHKAEVRMVTNIPPNQLLASQNTAIENFTGGGPFSLDRDTFIASQEVLLTSLPLFEEVQKKAEADVAEVMSAQKQFSDYLLDLKKFSQIILFGREYAENLGQWKNPEYTKFINRLTFTPRPDDGTFIIGYTDLDPLTAIRVTSYITEVLIELNIRMAKDESGNVASFLRQRLETAKTSSQEASLNLANFLKEANLPSDPVSLRDRYNLYVTALREDDNSTRLKVRSEARLAETESYIKILQDTVNRSVLTGTDIKVDNLLTELRRIESAEVKNRVDDENEREVASDFFSEQTEPIRQKVANEIAKYGTYVPLKDLLDLLTRTKLDVVKQRQSLAEDTKYDEFTRGMLSKYENEIKKYPEFQTRLQALMAEVNQKNRIVDQIYQEYLRYSVKSESNVSRIYSLQKPMIVSGFFNSGKLMSLLSLLLMATILVPLLSGMYHLLRGTIYSKYQIMKRSDIHFVGVFPHVPSLTKEALTSFCSSSEPIFRVSLEASHIMQRFSSNTGRVIAMASATPGNGTSVSTFGLSKGLNRLRNSVLVIDCDFLNSPTPEGQRQSGVTRFFIDNGSEESLEDVDALLTRLKSNTSGKQNGITFVKMVKGDIQQTVYVEVLKEKFAVQLEQLKEFYDFIILDGPALSVTEGLMLIEQANGVMLCCPEGNMTVSEFGQAISVVNQHIKNDAILLSVLSNARLPENLNLDDNYSSSPLKAA